MKWTFVFLLAMAMGALSAAQDHAAAPKPQEDHPAAPKPQEPPKAPEGPKPQEDHPPAPNPTKEKEQPPHPPAPIIPTGGVPGASEGQIPKFRPDQLLGLLPPEVASAFTENGRKKMRLESGFVYQITSKLDGSALTADPISVEIMPIVSRGYNGAAGQKWRLKKAFFGSSFQLIPTIQENALLDLDRNDMGFWGRFFGFGNQKYWNLIDVGDGAAKIQNWQRPDLCLTAQGLGNPVVMAPCVNHPAQQWQFALL